MIPRGVSTPQGIVVRVLHNKVLYTCLPSHIEVLKAEEGKVGRCTRSHVTSYKFVPFPDGVVSNSAGRSHVACHEA